MRSISRSKKANYVHKRQQQERLGTSASSNYRVSSKKVICIFKAKIFLQGLSTGFDIIWRPRRPTKKTFLVKMKVSVYSLCLGILVSSTNFWISIIGWPQQPPSERVPYISEKLDFWWSISQKMTSIGHFGAIDDQTIRIRIFFEEIGL